MVGYHIYGSDVAVVREKEDYYITELRAQAEAAGIQTRFVIKGDTESTEYRKAVEDFNFAQTMLALEDDDVRFVDTLANTGLSASQYRIALEHSAAEAKRRIDVLSEDTVLPTNEFLAYVASRAQRAENAVRMASSQPVKKRPSVFPVLGFIIAIALILVVVSAVVCEVFPGKSSGSDDASNSASPVPNFVYASFLNGSNYHTRSCVVFADGDFTEDDLIIYDGLLDARASGKPPCPSCMGDNNRATYDSGHAPAIVPDSGTILEDTMPGERIAPFEIKTSGSSDYLVKLESAYDPSKYISIYVHGGDTVEVDVPLGDYYMKYASGKIWYGKFHLFGEDTYCEKADNLFRFYEDSEYVNGHTVTLYPVSGGNMDTEAIDVLDF